MIHRPRKRSRWTVGLFTALLLTTCVYASLVIHSFHNTVVSSGDGSKSNGAIPEVSVHRPSLEASAASPRVDSSIPSNIVLSGNNRIKPNQRMTGDHFCVPWFVNADAWWTRNPTWEASKENDTHYCFSKIQDQDKADLYQRIYTNQVKNNCSNVITQEMYSSGWGADFSHVVDAMEFGLQTHRPAQVTTHTPWHYAVNKDGTNATCPDKTMYCYFLPLTHCPPRPERRKTEFLMGRHPVLNDPKTVQMFQYATRPQTWLRHAVYDMAKTMPIQEPCAVLHVRRADTILHQDYSRKYHKVEEYMRPAIASSPLLFLLTDDANAVQEAKTNYPNHQWVYFDRPRFRGAEGGWENQIPSQDPKREVVTLLATFQLVPRCRRIAFSQSNIGTYMAALIWMEHLNRAVIVNLDEGKQYGEIYNKSYAMPNPVK